ncbi:MAG: hypothetical protein LBJ35_02745, partial [Spirochaetaceae bacterium]|nr:hypothetical protein [Spirochaetaceae bacterium]
MHKLKLGLAALITAIALSSCGDAVSDALVAAAGTTQPDQEGKTPVKDIVVSFKNGWETATPGELKDDDYTSSVNVHKALDPPTVNPVVDTEELSIYNAANDEWKRIKALWDDYQTKL